MLERCLAEIYDGRPRVGRDTGGTGYLVGPGLILTAHHVLAPAGQRVVVGTSGYDVRILGDCLDGRTDWLEASIAWDDPEQDLALLRIPPAFLARSLAVTATLPEVGRPEGSERLPWTAMGFALVRKRQNRNDILPVDGDLDPRTATKLGVLDMTVHGGLVPRKTRDWGGMSGAPVFVADRLAGVVVEASALYAGNVVSARLVSRALEAGGGLAEALFAPEVTPPVWRISRAPGSVGTGTLAPDPEFDGLVAGLLKHAPERLFGREAVLAAVEKYVDGPATRPLLIRAPAGFGKTALCAAWLASARRAGRSVAAHFFNAQYATSPVLRAVRSLLRQVRAIRRDIVIGESETPDFVTTRRLLYAALSDFSDANAPVVLLLDGLDEMDEPMEPLFPSPLPPGLRVVLTVQNDAGFEPSWLSRWTRQAIEELVLEALDASSVAEWAHAAFGDDQIAGRAAAELFQTISDRSKGYPLFLNFLLRDLAESLAAGLAVEHLAAEIPEGFREYIRREIVRTAEASPSLDRTEAWLAVLSVAPEPVPRSLVEAAIGEEGLALLTLPPPIRRWIRTTTDGKGETCYHLPHALMAAEMQAVLGRKAVERARGSVIDACTKHGPEATEFSLIHLPQLLADAAVDDVVIHDQLISLSRNDAFANAQLEYIPDRPYLQLQTLRLALESATRRGDSALMAELILRRLPRRTDLLSGQSVLQILRADGEPAQRLRRATWIADQRGAPWPLLVQAELRRQDLSPAATAVAAGGLGGLTMGWKPKVAVALLWAASQDHPERAADGGLEMVPEPRSDGVRFVETGVSTALEWLVFRLLERGRWVAAERLATALGGPDSDLAYEIMLRRITQDCAEGRWRDGLRRLRELRLYRFAEAMRFAEILARQGGLSRSRKVLGFARRNIERIEDPERRTGALRALAFSAARAGCPKEAIEAARSLRDLGEVANCLIRLSASVDDPQPYIGAAQDAATSLDTPSLSLAVALARAGRKTEADAIIEAIRTQAADRRELLLDIVEAQIAIGDLPGARATVLRSGERAWPIAEMMSALCLAEARELGGALSPEEIGQELDRLGMIDKRRHLLSDLALDAAADGRWERLNDLAEWVLMRDIGPASEKLLPAFLPRIAAELARSGETDKARRVMALGPEDEDAWTALAEALVAKGCEDVEAELVEDLSRPLDQWHAESASSGEHFLHLLYIKHRDDPIAERIRQLGEAAGDYRLAAVRAGAAVGLSGLGQHEDAFETALRVSHTDLRDAALRTVGCAAVNAGRLDIAAQCHDWMVSEGSPQDRWVKQNVRVAVFRRLVEEGAFQDAVALAERLPPIARARALAALGALARSPSDTDLLKQAASDLDPPFAYIAYPALARCLVASGDPTAGQELAAAAYTWAKDFDAHSPVRIGDAVLVQTGEIRDETAVELFCVLNEPSGTLDPDGRIRDYALEACARNATTIFREFPFVVEIMRRGATDAARSVMARIGKTARRTELREIAGALGADTALDLDPAWSAELSDEDYLLSLPLLRRFAEREPWKRLSACAAQSAESVAATEAMILALVHAHPDIGETAAKIVLQTT